jgi:hypothetical protein
MADPLDKKIELPQEDEVKEARPGLGRRLKQKMSWRPKLSRKKVLIPFGLIILLLIFGFFFGFLPLMEIKNDVDQLNQEVSGVTEGIQAQNLNQSVEKLEATKVSLKKLEDDYRRLAWLRVIPFIASFYQDGQRLINGGGYLIEAGDVALEALQPYADILGLEGEGELKKPEEMTTEERLMLALDTLDKLQPSLDKISEKLDLAKEEIAQIDPNRYPETLFDREIREKVVVVIKTIDSTAHLASEIKPVIGYLRPLLGVPDKKEYFFLFQNDAELRPTGGFMTAYATLSVHNGKFNLLSSHDIYTLDARFPKRIKAPEPILNYLPNVPYWYLRDMNLSPDFTVSMDTFWENYQLTSGSIEADAIIAVDTKFLVELMKVLGPIGVPEFGNFSAEEDPRCDCPQVFYELERYADKPVGTLRTERKGIIGPLMHSILLNVMGSPRKKWPEFFNVTLSAIQEKHLLFYFFEEEIQKGMEALNASGRIKDFDGDYLHINDTNFAGAKSNMYIQVNVEQKIEVGPDGEIVKTITIDYKNPAPPSDCNLERGELCLNGLYRDWVRLYVPQGSELIDSQGSEVEIKTYEELGKTVFEAFYGLTPTTTLRPLGKTQLVFKYKLPFKAEKGSEYKLLIQKQPGTYGYEHRVLLDGREETFELKTDKELNFKI